MIKRTLEQIQSIPIVALCLGVILGICLLQLGFGVLIITIIFGSVYFRQLRKMFVCGICIGTLCLWSHETFIKNRLATASGVEQFELTLQEKMYTGYGQDTFKAWCEECGLYVQVSLSQFDAYEVGNRIKIEGEISEVDKNADKNKYLISQGIRAIISSRYVELLNNSASKTFNFGEEINAQIQTKLWPPYSDLISGMLLGIESGINTEIEENFKAAGVVHVLVVSGGNFSFVAALGLWMRKWLGNKAGIILSLCSIVVYLLMVSYQNQPALRAFIMWCLILTAKLLGRRVNVFVILLLAIALMLMINPWAWWGMSMWLSVTAVLGILLFTDVLAGNSKNIMVTNIVTSLAVTLGTAPVLLLAFGEVNLWGILANLVVLPIVSALSYLGVILVITPVGILSELVAGLSRVCMEIIISFTNFIADLSLVIAIPQALSALGLICLLGVVVYRYKYATNIR